MFEYKLIARNSYGDSVDFYNDPEIFLTSAEGVSSETTVGTAASGCSDGSAVTGLHVPEREITINARYHQKEGTAEAPKLRLYRVFRPKTEITLEYISPLQSKFIKGYCSQIDTPPNGHPLVTQIVLLCPDPYWINSEKGHAELTDGLLTINYDGDSEAGADFTLNVNEEVSNLGVENVVTGEIFGVYDTFFSGDTLRLCTKRGRISAVLERDGEQFNMMSKIGYECVPLKLRYGTNIFRVSKYKADIGLSCEYDILYGGV
ncbi:MAG: phage tail family protein [Ruminococcus sp.]|nr:phage tail family protein [Ruminococcus sp.]